MCWAAELARGVTRVASCYRRWKRKGCAAPWGKSAVRVQAGWPGTREVGIQFLALLPTVGRLFCSQQCLRPDLVFLLSQGKESNAARAADKGAKVAECETTVGTAAQGEEAWL